MVRLLAGVCYIEVQLRAFLIEYAEACVKLNAPAFR